MKRLPVTVIFMITAGLILVALVVRAVADRSIMQNGHLMSDVWFQVTLLDAYIGFGIFYAWVVHRERSVRGRVAGRHGEWWWGPGDEEEVDEIGRAHV